MPMMPMARPMTRPMGARMPVAPMMAAQRPGGMPGKEVFDLVALGRLIVDRVHGQPLSTPAALSSSASFFRA